MWSPHTYRQLAESAGIGDEIIDSALEWANRFEGGEDNSPAIIFTLNHLAIRSEVDYKYLRQVVERDRESYYYKFPIEKRSGGVRYIHVPERKLARVQKWISKFILKVAPVHEASFAFAPNCSIKKCAIKHCSARWLIKLDITGFFESISEIQVYRAFQELGYNPLVSFELSRIITINSAGEKRRNSPEWQIWKKYKGIPQYSSNCSGYLGYLPQGASTSPMASNLVMKKIDSEISELAKNSDLVYTRYSDDMTFSTGRKDFGREIAVSFIKSVSKILQKNGFHPNHRKTTIVPPGARKLVLGLNVDGQEPKLRKKFKDNIRAHIYYLAKFGPVQHKKKRQFKTLYGMKNHIRGLIDFSNMIEPEFATNMLEKFNKIQWPENLIDK